MDGRTLPFFLHHVPKHAAPHAHIPSHIPSRATPTRRLENPTCCPSPPAHPPRRYILCRYQTLLLQQPPNATANSTLAALPVPPCECVVSSSV